MPGLVARHSTGPGLWCAGHHNPLAQVNPDYKGSKGMQVAGWVALCFMLRVRLGRGWSPASARGLTGDMGEHGCQYWGQGNPDCVNSGAGTRAGTGREAQHGALVVVHGHG